MKLEDPHLLFCRAESLRALQTDSAELATALFPCAPGLQRLKVVAADAAYSSGHTDQFLSALRRHCPQLRRLDVGLSFDGDGESAAHQLALFKQLEYCSTVPLRQWCGLPPGSQQPTEREMENWRHAVSERFLVLGNAPRLRTLHVQGPVDAQARLLASPFTFKLVANWEDVRFDPLF
jgi:hypothetical protein